ncbi:hypothetical protein ACS0PU_003728 [Formica fusca]
MRKHLTISPKDERQIHKLDKNDRVNKLDHRTEIVEGAYRWCNLFSITRYMRDGSILPRISTSCDDLQRRITKPPKSIVL